MMHTKGINLSETSSNYWHDPAVLKQLYKDETWHQDPEVEKTIYSRLEPLEPASAEISTKLSKVYAYYFWKSPDYASEKEAYKRLGLKTITQEKFRDASRRTLPLRMVDGIPGHLKILLGENARSLALTPANIKQYLLHAQANKSKVLMDFCLDFCTDEKALYEAGYSAEFELRTRELYLYALGMLSFATEHKLHALANEFLATGHSSHCEYWQDDESKISDAHLKWHQLLGNLETSPIRPKKASGSVSFSPRRKEEWNILGRLYDMMPKLILELTCSAEDIKELNAFAMRYRDVVLDLTCKGQFQDKHLKELTAPFEAITLRKANAVRVIPHSLTTRKLEVIECPSLKQVFTTAKKAHFWKCRSLKELQAPALQDFDARGMKELKVVVAPALRTFQCDEKARFDVLDIPPHLCPL